MASQESVHPNEYGTTLFADALEAALAGFYPYGLLAVAAGIVLVTLPGCVPPSAFEQARTGSVEAARAAFDQFRERILAGAAEAPSETFVEYAAETSLEVGRSMIGMTDDEMRKFLFSGTDGRLIAAESDGSTATVLGNVVGYSQATNMTTNAAEYAYACFDVMIPLDDVSAMTYYDALYPKPVIDAGLSSGTLLELADLEE